MMRTYTVVFVREEDGRYCVHVPALRGCHAWGENLPHALDMAKEAMRCHIASMEKHGEPLPEDVETVVFEWGEAQEAVAYRVALSPGEAVTVA